MNAIDDLANFLLKFDNWSQFTKDNWKFLGKVTGKFMVPKKTVIEERPFEPSDFDDIPVITAKYFKLLSNFFSRCRNIAIQQNANSLECIYSVLLLSGEHSADDLWTSAESRFNNEELLLNLIQSLSTETVDIFLLNKTQSKYHALHLFEKLSAKLSNGNWKYFPAAVKCYAWLLYKIKIPHMNEFISFALPIALSIMSDWEIGNKVLGLQCLHHLITNITTAELQWHMQVEGLQNLLKPLFYIRETQLIHPLTECTLEIINKSQFTSKVLNINTDLKWSYMDEVLSLFLPMMEYEYDTNRRRAYAQSLLLIFQHSDFAIGKWSTSLLRIIDDYSKTDNTQVVACQILLIYLKICWPLVKNHWKFCNVIAGRVLFNSLNKEAISAAESALELMRQLLPEMELVDPKIILTRKKTCSN